MRRSLYVVAALLAAAVAVQAQVPPIEFHGFGQSSYRKTDDNLYLGGTPKGSYSQSELSLAISASLSDRLKVSTQGLLTEQSEGGVHTALTYAFIEYAVTDDVKLRAGQIKLPFGNYGEIVHVGTLRPFLTAPQAVYGPVGVGVGPRDIMTGVGLTGSYDLTPRVELAYDLYGGGMKMIEYLPPEAFLAGEPVSNATSMEQEVTHDVLGGRLLFRLPARDLEAGVSGYHGQELVGESMTKPRWAASVHSQLENDRWLVRAEVARETVKEDLKVKAAYVEAAYKLTQHWQVAAQLSSLRTEIWDVSHPIAPSFLDHREKIVGLNYWITPQAVFKTSYHRIDGNRFAGPNPDQYDAVVGSGGLNPKTSLFMLGIDFSF